ncbi:uncharacterized protein LOC115628701 [Scaptodrosophila lebanonensis]|uniref:Uncharacterized protein LOC115628701 n=1 Tax=Drosophila lebanonensis TaxID=7225 RepID=A0A6J2U0U8_DROLE|nr:uncharacterized protein LOC115628701 [Scaptodrosophila lebanonensis]XP_030380742.1 uncharacterized protein LOC115628701 [Scaptodrosophila lebanonensis]
MLAYTKLLADMGQQLSLSARTGILPAGFRPTRNTLICAGATAAACVALGAAVKALRRRSDGTLKSITSSKLAEELPKSKSSAAAAAAATAGGAGGAGGAGEPDPAFVNWRRVEDTSDCDSDIDCDVQPNPNANARVKKAYYILPGSTQSEPQ